MPLSEHEQRMLEQLEKQLHDEDPKFANSMGSDALKSFSTRHIVLGVLGVIVGILVLLIGVSLQSILLGVVGFLMMSASVYYGTVRHPGKSGKGGTGAKDGKPKSSFLGRLEEQWEHRRQQDG